MANNTFRLKIVTVLRNFRALLAEADGTVIGFRGAQELRIAPPFNHPRPLGRLPMNWRQTVSAFRLAGRVLRTDVFRMVVTPTGTHVGVSREGVLRREANERRFRVVFRDFRGSRPLSLCVDRDGRIYFGEYFGNPEREAVHVYCSSDDGQTWRPCYTFEPREIRHVHGLQYDAYRDKIWVLSGDYGHEAQVGLASPGFDEYRIVAQADQLTRAVSAVCRPDALIYGTDSPLVQNHIVRLDPDTGRTATVADVQHSVFFTGEACGGLFLSTVVEPSEVHATDSVHVWYSPDGLDWREVLQTPHDGWSLRVFQFPSAFIAAGPPDCPYVFLSLRGVRGYDGDCLVGRIERTPAA